MDRDAVRTKVRTAVRRGIGKVDALDRVVVGRNLRRDRMARLVELYERLRAQVPAVAGTPAGELPHQDRVAAVERAALDSLSTRAFLSDVVDGGDFDRAVVALVRTMMDVDLGRARSIAQVIQRDPATRPLGDVCQALVTIREPLLDTAWRLFTRNDPAVAMRLAPLDFFKVAFLLQPDAAVAVLGRAAAGEYDPQLFPGEWLDLARSALVVGAEDVAARTADRADAELGQVGPQRAKQLSSEIGALRGWLGRRELARADVPVPDGAIAIGVLTSAQPGRPLADPSEADAANTLAALGNLVRRRGVRLSGDPDLVALAESLRTGIDPQRAIDGDDATVFLCRVDREASDYDALPQDTWLLASGTFAWTPNDLQQSLPLNPRVRPLFVGFDTEPWALHGAGVLDDLRAHAPIGCRDWRTVQLLQAADVPAFYSGWLTTTLDTVVRAQAPGVFGKVLADLRGAAGTHVVTKQTREYVAARSVGATVEFRPAHPNDVALEGLAGITDAQFDDLRTRSLDVTGSALEAILTGSTADEVYAAWREACAPYVAEAEARREESLAPLPPPSFDVAAAVRQTLDASLVVERTQPAPDGPEINVEFSLDGNYKHQLDVVLDSIVITASRPIRAFVLARDHTQADFDRMARLFPTVSFVWLPTDNADYGPISGMLKHITVATMDRLLLPDLLPDVDRIIHHDLDALCLADLADLFDVPMGDSPIAARDQRHPFQGSGYISMTRGIALAETAELSHELMLRLIKRHPFDYRTFNAGIMVLNLAQMRDDRFTRDYLPLIERFGFNDQGLLNLYAGSQHYEFERAWNAYPRFELTDDAKILHWLGPWKPWHPPFIDGQPLWREAEARVIERQRAAALR